MFGVFGVFVFVCWFVACFVFRFDWLVLCFVGFFVCLCSNTCVSGFCLLFLFCSSNAVRRTNPSTIPTNSLAPPPPSRSSSSSVEVRTQVPLRSVCSLAKRSHASCSDSPLHFFSFFILVEHTYMILQGLQLVASGLLLSVCPPWSSYALGRVVFSPCVIGYMLLRLRVTANESFLSPMCLIFGFVFACFFFVALLLFCFFSCSDAGDLYGGRVPAALHQQPPRTEPQPLPTGHLARCRCRCRCQGGAKWTHSLWSEIAFFFFFSLSRLRSACVHCIALTWTLKC